MKDREPRQAPPIPPRRLKRKNKPTVLETDGVTEGATTSGILIEPRPRLPPPPLPQRGHQRRGVRPELLPRSEVTEVRKSCSPPVNRQSRFITGDKLPDCDTEEVQTPLSTFGTNPALRQPTGKNQGADDPPRRKREKGKIPRPNEYPPLFFTLQDFQDVMSGVDNSYSRTLKNMTTFEPTPRPRTSKISGDDQLPGTPEDEEVLFRVTTTNLPFEKSSSEWGDVRNDPNHFIFEDYVDRRQIPLQSRSKPQVPKLVLFGDDTFDREDDDRTISTSRTASRVRFLVDSTTRDVNGEKTELDSLQNIDSLPLDFPVLEDAVLRENSEDEFGEVPFDSLLKISNDDASSLCVDRSEDSNSSKTDFQTILVTAMIEPVHFPEEVEKPFEKGGQASDSNAEFPAEKHPSLFEEEETLKDEDAADETKSPSSDTNELEANPECETEKNIAVPKLSDERDKGVKSIERIEDGEEFLADKSIGNLTVVDNQEDKSPPENIRRNSFMMNMLQGDEERVVCKVVATHPKTPIHGSRIEGGTRRGNPSAGAAVEAKSKLLGELSSSFSAIRLKPVNNGGEESGEKQSAGDLKVDSINEGREEIVGREEEILDKEAENNTENILNRNLDNVLDSYVVKCKLSEEPIEDSREPRNEPQDRSKVCSQKTDDIIDKIYVENDAGVGDGDCNKNVEKTTNYTDEGNNDNDGNHSGVKFMENKEKEKNEKNVEVESRCSVDKCAIVLKCNNNNNNDNNAMTHVDVSYDQSPHNVSIIPGSVRSFVKFYEIQGETSVGLNNNDATNANANANAAAAASVPKIKVEATGCAGDDFQEITQKKFLPRYTGMEIENDIKYTIVARKPVLKKITNTSPAGQISIANQPLDKYYQSISPVLGNHTGTSVSRFMPVELLDADRQRELQFHPESDAIRSLNVGGNEHERRRPKSRASTSKKFDKTVNVASGIAPGKQDGSTSGVIKDVERSGTTNHSVPKSSTSTINEHYTFYCTV